MDARKRLDRFSTEPRKNRAGQPLAPLVTPRRISILELLASHRTLNADDILVVLNGSRTHLYESLSALKRKPLEYIRIVPAQLTARNRYQKDSFELTAKGVTFLNDRGHSLSVPSRIYNLRHATLVSHVMASIAAGVARHPDARFISWDEIRAHPKFPKQHDTKDDIRPDTHPFRIQLMKEGVPVWRTVVIEADNGTETIKPTKPERYTGNSIYAKFEAYLRFMEDEEFKKRYGVSNYFVLFVFSSRSRLDNAKKLLESMGGNRFILFQQAYQEPEIPAGYIFTSACERAGYPSLFLNQP